MSVLSVKGLKKAYKKGFIPRKQEVLKGVDFAIASGTITGFLGANGAGKTTTLKCLLGLTYPDAGTLEYFGERGLSQEQKKRIGFLPERPYFYEYLTGAEFLRFYGELSGYTRSLNRRIDEMLEKVGLWDAKHKRLGEYSKGMLQKIGLGQALIHDPELIILDEPMAGLDPDGRHALSEIIKETTQSGKSVFFSSHLLHDAERLCEDLVILRDGQAVYQGKTQDLISEVGFSTEITYSKGGRESSIHVESPDQLQEHIDRLRAENAEILQVDRQRKSLEEAFVNMAFRRKTGHENNLDYS